MSAPRRHPPEVIDRTKALWVSGVSPQMIADALEAEFKRKFTPCAVNSIAQRNEFPPAKRSLRGGGSEEDAFTGADLSIRSSSERYLAALQADCPRFDSAKAS